MGVRAEQKGTKVEDFIRFVADANTGRVRMLPPLPEDADLDPPFKSAAAVALYELKRLERSIDDKRVYSSAKGQRRGYASDDVAQVIVHTHAMVQNSQVLPTDAKMRSRIHRLKAENVGGAQWGQGNAGHLFSPSRSSGGSSKRRW